MCVGGVSECVLVVCLNVCVGGVSECVCWWCA